jgi:aspartyl-tRNA(Asn)/glutamyl-tRNA(Gln) amidotransferase subunit A
VSARELWELSAAELVAGYRARTFSPREVVEALAGRIERLNPSLGAFNTLCLDRALAEADAPRPGPLSGVPFAAKDLFDSAGVRTTYGSRMFTAHVPDRDAAAVAAVRAAGGVLVGKTQTHEFAWGITSVNEAMGTSRNPWMTDRVPGGSSGGSAVALAARLVPIALGSDTGGSIRIPAAFCGVTGLKPTYGRLDTAGVWPLAPSLDHVGPMARTPGDLALLFGAMGGGEGHDAGAASDATVVICPDLHLAPLEPEMQRVFDDVVATFERMGARVEERPFARATRLDETFRLIQAREAGLVHEAAGLFPARADDYGKDVRTRLEYAAAVSLEEYVHAAAERELLRAEFGRLLADGALLLTPVSAVAPVRADDFGAARDFRAGVLPYTTPQNLAGLPSCAVRAGFDRDGLPAGVQLTGAPWRDHQVLAAARALCEARPGVQASWPEL